MNSRPYQEIVRYGVYSEVSKVQCHIHKDGKCTRGNIQYMYFVRNFDVFEPND